MSKDWNAWFYADIRQLKVPSEPRPPNYKLHHFETIENYIYGLQELGLEVPREVLNSLTALRGYL